MSTSIRLPAALALALAVALPLMPAHAQMPVDAASDRRPNQYVFFKAFGRINQVSDLTDVSKIREASDRYFITTLADCRLADPACDAEKVYELADRYCQALEFDEAVSWRTSKSNTRLVLHWTVCGFKK